MSQVQSCLATCAGTVGAAGQSNETIQALHTVGSSISMLTTQHLVSARVFGAELRLKLRQLAGLNESVIAAAVFDGKNQYRAYAVTTDMQLLLLQVSDQGRRAVRVRNASDLKSPEWQPVVGPAELRYHVVSDSCLLSLSVLHCCLFVCPGGDLQKQFLIKRTQTPNKLQAASETLKYLKHCKWGTEMQWLHVQVMSRVPLSLAPTGGPVHLTHARGYLFLAAPTGVAVFNTTGFDNRRGPKMVLAHPYSNVAADLARDGMVSCSVHMLSNESLYYASLASHYSKKCSCASAALLVYA